MIQTETEHNQTNQTEHPTSDDAEYQRIEQQMPEMLALINSLKADYYTNITDTQREKIKQTMDFLVSHFKESKGQALFTEIYNHMREPTQLQKVRNKLIEKNFDLNDHLRKLAKEYGKMSSADLSKCFAEKEPVSVGLNIIPLYTSNREQPAGPEYDRCVELANTAWQKMTEPHNSPNQTLAELAKEKKLTFKILDSDKFDGRFAAEKLSQNELVIELTRGCFSPERLPDMPMLLAHECGHLIDACKRPQGYLGDCKNGEEYVADSCGAQMAMNAGFEISGYTRFLQETGNKHNNPLLINRANILKKIAQNHQQEKIIQNHKMQEMTDHLNHHRTDTI